MLNQLENIEDLKDQYAKKFHAVLVITRQAKYDKLVFDNHGKFQEFNGKSLLEECEKFWVARESYEYAEIAHKALLSYTNKYGNTTKGSLQFADGFGTISDHVELYG